MGENHGKHKKKNGWFWGSGIFFQTLISQLIEENPKQATKIHVLFFGCPKKYGRDYHLVAGILQVFFEIHDSDSWGDSSGAPNDWAISHSAWACCSSLSRRHGFCDFAHHTTSGMVQLVKKLVSFYNIVPVVLVFIEIIDNGTLENCWTKGGLAGWELDIQMFLGGFGLKRWKNGTGHCKGTFWVDDFPFPGLVGYTSLQPWRIYIPTLAPGFFLMDSSSTWSLKAGHTFMAQESPWW